MGAFAEWQPRYAELGISTFPVSIDGKRKKPAVQGYLKIGIPTSGQLALKFPAHDAIGLACKRNRITVLDVDTTDERVLADGLSRHGHTPFIVRSGSGNFQAWYRNGGEKRRIRPVADVPIDILGDGYVVAPPSMGSRGKYEIIQGSFDDLSNLPRMKIGSVNDDIVSEPEVVMQTGPACSLGELLPREQLAHFENAGFKSNLREGQGRNDALFRRALRSARYATTKEELIQMVAQANKQFPDQLPMDEILSVSGSAWKYKQEGRLMVPGGEATAVVFKSDMDHLWDQPLAMTLLLRLRMTHGWRNGEPFILAKGTAETLDVSYPTYLAARDVLVARFFLEIVHPGGKGKNDPPMARLL